MENTYLSDRSVKDIFELLANTSSGLKKQEILTANSENDSFMMMLDYLLNPFHITGISTKKITKETEKDCTRQFSSFEELMEYILVNNTGTDEVIANIQGFLNSHPQDMQDFYVSIITKSARLGCDIKSVNKAFGSGFIPQWEVQQAYSVDKSPLKENEWFSLSQKLNGVRGTFFEGRILSRQGKEFNGLDHIIRAVDVLLTDADERGAEEWVLDGELVRLNTDGLSDNENFRIGTGLLSQDDADKSVMQLVIFDALPKEEFVTGESKSTYKERLEMLGRFKDSIAKNSLHPLSVVEVFYSGCDAGMIDIYLEKMVSEDKEGLMLNRDSKYYRKRHNGILKVKRFYTVDLVVCELEEGSGRLSGMLGAFVVDYKGNRLNVGSGMSDEQRVTFWNNRDSMVGRVIEVKYKEESSDKKTGLNSLQFPIFVALREEGKEESYD